LSDSSRPIREWGIATIRFQHRADTQFQCTPPGIGCYGDSWAYDGAEGSGGHDPPFNHLSKYNVHVIVKYMYI